MRTEDLGDYLRLRKLARNAWQTIRFRKRQGPGKTLRVEMRDGFPLVIRGDRNDHHMFHRIYMRDEYRLASLKDPPWQTVIDIGGNVGLFTTRVAPFCDRVITYEPFPANFAQLELNAGSRPNVTIVRAAVAGQSGTLKLYHPAAEQLSGVYSSFREMGGLMSDAFDEVEAISLEELFERHAVTHCDLIKIDVEGQEYEIFKAAPPELFARIERIHGEYHNVRPDDPGTRIDEFAKSLRSHNFEVEVVPHRRKENHGLFFACKRG